MRRRLDRAAAVLRLTLLGALLLALLLAPLAASLAGCRSWRGRGPRPAYKKISPAVAYAMTLDAPDVLILDLRTPEEFQGETGHIRNARNFPVKRLPSRLYELTSFRDDTLLVYCREKDNCAAEGMAILVSSGFEDAILIDGGIDRWIREGFKTVLSVETPDTTPGGAGGGGRGR
jgi:rhodanese-related sulfurtransferase